ncbi:hypothetical protein H2200_011878 [Cladophialophora chaetospira]|uniref:BTB domain-containing protein n=1 Tax=Cladophialophora chaetospira TaxID=386627 RepID=A0AA38WYZ5_9EURO|nr:hypothetical protein H2200_011878 [Cladophialophora chaetospira]
MARFLRSLFSRFGASRDRLDDQEATSEAADASATASQEGRSIDNEEAQSTSTLECVDESQSFATSGLINILVGENRTLYQVHKHVVEREPGFFSACLRNGWIEAQTGEIKLLEESCQGFDIVIEWLYGKKVEKMDITKQDGIMPRLKAYGIAQMMCMSALQNAIVESLKHHWARVPMRPEYLTWAAENLNSDCALLGMLIDQFVWDTVKQNLLPQLRNHIDPPIKDKHYDNLLRVLAITKLSTRYHDSITTWSNTAGLESPVEQEGCHYHFHEQGETCEQE